jgi:hypothetical protein
VHTSPDVRAGGGVLLDRRLVSRLGKVAAHEPLDSNGWSGNVIERLVLADGRRLIAKRILPGTGWIDRHTKDWGREALLFGSGVLDRMPAAIDHAILAAEPDGVPTSARSTNASSSSPPRSARPSATGSTHCRSSPRPSGRRWPRPSRTTSPNRCSPWSTTPRR